MAEIDSFTGTEHDTVIYKKNGGSSGGFIPDWKMCPWFVHEEELVICGNSNCIEENCNVYTWNVSNDTLFLSNSNKVMIFIRESTNPDTFHSIP